MHMYNYYVPTEQNVTMGPSEIDSELGSAPGLASGSSCQQAYRLRKVTFKEPNKSPVDS